LRYAHILCLVWPSNDIQPPLIVSDTKYECDVEISDDFFTESFLWKSQILLI